MPSCTPSSSASATTAYRIVIRGRLSERFASAFPGMTIEPGAGETALVGDIADIFPVIDRLRDFGLELLSLEEMTR